ncbi:LppP/LprE family lipoprotein [Streptomyces roseolus]|uniref:LppP/LprE family lipoprotein n=1 Tax=Streptomyces roseolus TaxID=67358 RepID=UPI00365D7582
MGIKPAVLVLAAGVALAVAGCGSDTPTPTATPTRPGTVTVVPPQTGPAVTVAPSPIEPPTITWPGTRTTTAAPPTAPVTVLPGSGHGYCFDLNSDLAHSGFAKVAAAEPSTVWTIPGASEDSADAGCAGVLSWMTMEGMGIHPVTHVLFFADGRYLGTASAEPYAYTQVVGKTRGTVSVQYRWALPEDALCCPTGGPSIVTFTLNGATVQAKGQFPPAG